MKVQFSALVTERSFGYGSPISNIVVLLALTFPIMGSFASSDFSYLVNIPIWLGLLYNLISIYIVSLLLVIYFIYRLGMYLDSDKIYSATMSALYILFIPLILFTKLAHPFINYGTGLIIIAEQKMNGRPVHNCSYVQIYDHKHCILKITVTSNVNCVAVLAAASPTQSDTPASINMISENHDDDLLLDWPQYILARHCDA